MIYERRLTNSSNRDWQHRAEVLRPSSNAREDSPSVSKLQHVATSLPDTKGTKKTTGANADSGISLIKANTDFAGFAHLFSNKKSVRSVESALALESASSAKSVLLLR